MSLLVSAGPGVGPRGPSSSPTGGRIVKRKLLDGTAKELNKNSRYATRATRKETGGIQCARAPRNENANSSDEEMATVEKVWELLDEYRAEFQGLKETLKEQNEIIRDQQEIIRKQKEDTEKQGTINQELSLHLKDIKQQMNDQLKQVQKQLEAIVAGAVVTPPSTFAEVARSTPSPQQSTVRSLSSNSTAESTANELFCMIDTSRVEEQDRGRATVAREFGVPSGRLRYRLQGRPPKAGQEAKNTRLSRPEEKALCRYIDRLDHINLAVRAEFVTDAANHILCERSGQTDSPLL
ncbi:hypothetical protein HIM_11400 [Hirsutella minnesotensis 3608]|uniref:HTH psq-type domain-containing protein n=1 Tax=Hirsutella minnesotensis 3608 TaxID=1043627 RepID=A0A0F7ZJ31_9HYPO|nr:hypothetical protein HIM_11400 [Hirsutella minnesotensis 3608]